jgi:hypothetical protein
LHDEKANLLKGHFLGEIRGDMGARRRKQSLKKVLTIKSNKNYNENEFYNVEVNPIKE